MLLLPVATARDLVAAIARHSRWPLHSARTRRYISVRRGNVGLPRQIASMPLSWKVAAAGIVGPLLVAGFPGAAANAAAESATTIASTATKRPTAGSGATGDIVLAQDVQVPEPPSARGMPPLGEDEFRLNYPSTPQYPNGYSRTFRRSTNPNPTADPMEVNDSNGGKFWVPPGTTFNNSSGTWQIPPDGSSLFPSWDNPFIQPGIPLEPTSPEDIPMSDNSPGTPGSSAYAMAGDPPPAIGAMNASFGGDTRVGAPAVDPQNQTTATAGTRTAETADPQGYTPVAYGGNEQAGGNTSIGSTSSSSTSGGSSTVGSYASGGGSTSGSYASGGGSASGSCASADGSTSGSYTSGGSTSSSSA